MRSRGYNNVEFGQYCSWGNLCHEFMHSLGKFSSSTRRCHPSQIDRKICFQILSGFYHEHTRTDRDKYVTIKWKNIPADWKHNFVRCNQRGQRCNDLKVGYDYGSIMHYSRKLKGMTNIII